MKKPTLFRYLFVSVWFIAAPLGLAVVAVSLLQIPDAAAAPGFGSGLRSLISEQPIPAGIVMFTLFEMTLWGFRHQLPGSSLLTVGGRQGLPVETRRDFEAAGHLLEEADRILKKHGKAIEREIPAPKRKELESALSALRTAIDREPLNAEEFSASFEQALGATRHLDAWRKGEVREYAESIGVAILVALLLRAVVVEAFKIPSGSMLPTLQINDHIFVNKFVYGPTIPFTKTRILSDMPPKRGDVIVFEFPDPDLTNPRQDFIKRVIALPGDTLEADNGHPIINGWKVPRCKVGAYQYADTDGFGGRPTADLYVEFLGEYAYLTIFETDAYAGHQGPYTVKPGEVWVFGDNRHNSSDSRAWFGGRGGGVPFDNIKGRALFVWLPPTRLFVNVMGTPQLPAGTPDHVVQGVKKCVAERPPLSETTPPPPGSAR